MGARAVTEPWWIALIEALLIVNLLMLTFAYMTWVERKVLGRMQLRYGPNRAGPFGLLQISVGMRFQTQRCAGLGNVALLVAPMRP
jgi:NADH:ubiquinone oxidoreductase subunit H